MFHRGTRISRLLGRAGGLDRSSRARIDANDGQPVCLPLSDATCHVGGRLAESDALAVVDSAETKRVIGLLTEQYALRRYSDELDRRRRELSGE